MFFSGRTGKEWSDVQSCSQAEKPACPTGQKLAKHPEGEEQGGQDLLVLLLGVDAGQVGGQPVEPGHSHGQLTTPDVAEEVD